MRSFAECLAEKKYYRLAEHAFTLMAERGVNPVQFVEWYRDEGHLFQGAILEQHAADWLEQELLLAEGLWDRYQQGVQQGTGPKSSPVAWAAGRMLGGAANMAGRARGWLKGQAGDIIQSFSHGVDGGGYGSIHGNNAGAAPGSPANPAAPGTGATGAPMNPAAAQGAAQGGAAVAPQVRDALAALRNLSRWSKHIPGLDAQVLQKLIDVLNNPPASGGQVVPMNPNAGATQQAAWHVPEGEPIAEAIRPVFTNHVQKRILDMKIERACREMAAHGINPELFVEWYLDEGQYLEGHLFEVGLRDRMGAWWQGAKSMFGNMFGNFRAGRDSAYTEKAKVAAQNAINALQSLAHYAQHEQPGFGGQELSQHLGTLMQNLNSFVGGASGPAPATAGGNAAPGTDPASGAADPAAAGEGDVAADSQKKPRTPEEMAEMVKQGQNPGRSIGKELVNLVQSGQVQPDQVLQILTNAAQAAGQTTGGKFWTAVKKQLPQSSQAKPEVQSDPAAQPGPTDAGAAPEPAAPTPATEGRKMTQQDIETAAYYFSQQNPQNSPQQNWELARQQLKSQGWEEWFKKLPKADQTMLEERRFMQSILGRKNQTFSWFN